MAKAGEIMQTNACIAGAPANTDADKLHQKTVCRGMAMIMERTRTMPTITIGMAAFAARYGSWYFFAGYPRGEFLQI